MLPTLSLLSLLALPLAANAFTFTLAAPPTQCGNLVLDWSGGTAPYEITLLPLGYLSPEIRTLVDVNTSSTSWSQQLLFPQGSTFVIVLSDATGYGSGGTSYVQTVGGGDGSCLPTGESSLPFTFYMSPETPSQCGSIDFTWDASAQGSVVISAVIPGGDSFTIPASSGTSTSWTADVQQGTEIAFIVGDAQGRGKGGSSDLMTVGGGSSGSCLSGNYPSSTAGPAAGAISSTGAASASPASQGSASASGSPSASSSLPPGSGGGTVTGSPIATGAGGSGQRGGNGSGQSSGGSTTSSSSNTGAIAGGVVGGVAALLILAVVLWCCLRRRRQRQTHVSEKVERADLLDPTPYAAGRAAGAGTGANGQGRNAHWYQQEAFVPPTTRPGVRSSASSHGHATHPSTANATEGPISSRGAATNTNTNTNTLSNPASSPTDTAAPLPPGAAAPASRADTAGDAALAAAAAAHDPKKRTPGGGRPPSAGRPVNWVQHDDAGAVPLSPPPAIEESEPVTVDVPPSYDALQPQQRRSPPVQV